MFKYANSSNEIAANMEKALAGLDTQKQETEEAEQLSKALDHLNAASELFETAGLVKEAEATTRLLEVVAKKKKPSKSKPTKSKSKSKSKKTEPKATKTNEAMKGLTSEKMVSNLKEKGWVFNVDDLDLNDDHEDECDCSMCMDSNDDWDMNLSYDEVMDPWSPNRGRW